MRRKTGGLHKNCKRQEIVNCHCTKQVCIQFIRTKILVGMHKSYHYNYNYNNNRYHYYYYYYNFIP